jgi:hypothetical protein
MVTESSETEISEPSIDFSIEELVALAEMLELRGLPGLGAEPLEHLEPEFREPVLASARRALVARRFLIPTEEGGFEVARVVAHIVARTARSGIQIRALYEEPGRVETRWFAAEPDLAIEHGVAIGTVQRLIPFRTEQLLARVLEFCAIATRPSNDAAAFSVDPTSVSAAIEAIADGNASGAVAILVAGGADERSAGAFVEALGHRVSSASVTILHRPTEAVVAGGELTWLDCGDHGLWSTPALGDEPGASDDSGEGSPVVIAPTTAKEIAEELLSYLPGAPAS